MAGTPYIGNNDFRGYLNYLAQNGDATAKALISGGNGYGYVDNNGNISNPGVVSPELQSYAADAYGYWAGGGGGGGGTGGSSTASSAPDEAAIAAWDQGIGNTNSAISRLTGQLNSGNEAIDKQTQDAIDVLTGNLNQGQADYTKNTTDTKVNYAGAKNIIGQNAGQTLTGVQRLLGSRGAGGGSAYSIAAPGVVARMATTSRNGASQTFGENMGNLESEWNKFDQNITNEKKKVYNQRDTNKQKLNSDIETSRATLLQNLANMQTQRGIALGGDRSASVAAAQPYLNQANGILDNLSNYSTPAIGYNTQAFTAPKASTYTTATQTPTFNGQNQGNDYSSPYLQSLLGGRKDKNTGVGGL